MSHGELQGWFADPFRLHEQRYFSAGRPTKLVRNGTVESYDEPPAETFDPAGEFATAYMSDQIAASGPVYARRRRSGFGAFRTIALLAVAAVVAVVVVAIRHGSGSEGTSHLASMSEVAFVTQSAQRTLAERTADVTISGSVQAAGQTGTLSGAGEIDFTTGAGALTEQVGVAGQQAVEKEIVAHGYVYYALTISGFNLVPMLSGGRDWIEAPVPLSSSAGFTGSDPRVALGLLEQHGDTVRVLGTRRIGGVTCRGYAVTPSRQVMTSAAQQEISALKLSSSEADLLLSSAPPTVTVWLDAHGVLHQMSLGLQIGGPTGAAASGYLTESFSNYGAPVHVTAPASADVISYQALRQMVANENIDKQSELRLLPKP